MITSLSDNGDQWVRKQWVRVSEKVAILKVKKVKYEQFRRPKLKNTQYDFLFFFFL